MANISFKAARVNKGLTLKEASHLLDVNIDTLSSYERGTTTPKIDTVVKMARLYDVSSVMEFTEVSDA